MNKTSVNIFWFRRDLRLSDNTALFHALQEPVPVLPIFIFDTYILDRLEDHNDLRVNFIHQSLQEIHHQLFRYGSGLKIFHSTVLQSFKELLNEYELLNVFANHDYEPYAIQRDESVRLLLNEHGAALHTYKDQVIFEKDEIVKEDGKPYTVFTPYSKKWKATRTDIQLNEYPSEKYSSRFFQHTPTTLIGLDEIGFTAATTEYPSRMLNEALIRHYSERRDFPALEGTSKLGIHLRFGTVSIRELVKKAISLNETFLNELIWREFYQMILWHFPHVASGHSFKPAYDGLEWRNDEGQFAAWCAGKTGYPIVDAGMHELAQTGYMHNRVRMITASFLTKHLLIDWRWGEAWFARKLLDFDLASNNGGWQWAAGCGCDAAPYFRIFNPALQTKKFDPGLKYIRHWVPELEDFNYPQPIVNHEAARKRCLEVYAKCLKRI